MVELCTKFERNRTIRGRVTYHLVNFCTFSLLSKIRGGEVAISELMFNDKARIYFWCVAAVGVGRFDTFSLPVFLGQFYTA